MRAPGCRRAHSAQGSGLRPRARRARPLRGLCAAPRGPCAALRSSDSSLRGHRGERRSAGGFPVASAVPRGAPAGRLGRSPEPPFSRGERLRALPRPARPAWQWRRDRHRTTHRHGTARAPTRQPDDAPATGRSHSGASTPAHHAPLAPAGHESPRHGGALKCSTGRPSAPSTTYTSTPHASPPATRIAVRRRTHPHRSHRPAHHRCRGAGGTRRNGASGASSGGASKPGSAS